MQQLRDRYALETLCVTLGEKGAALLDKTGFVQQAGFPVEVADTIGSGDAFLAAFFTKRYPAKPPRKPLSLPVPGGLRGYATRRHIPVLRSHRSGFF